ncbi:thioether cross-link-forming SCIFF peptide maturase [Acetobacterium bakii]|uniref:Radical SAM protein n=1 Tax=Acetobacterium bakii TaxID=52689 RepID=A0A0L6TWW7_9FIRM|nr:thioether cross-link-forming SCIFF peptide maturase [Acetobacterium bakii]KNZ40759.1 radical SAM protein [Acetobacterium bakii]
MVHTYSLNGYNIAVDGNSGSVHLLDDLTYEILQDEKELPVIDLVVDQLQNKYDQKEIIEAFDEIKRLKSTGFLFSSIEEIENASITENINTNLKALCLHVSHDCNLRCEYCFASEGDYNSGRELMKLEVAIQAVDYLVANSGGRKIIEIDFFGGEPLMNFDVVEAVVKYGRKIEKEKNKQFYFTITTNGTLLNKHRIEFINEHMDNVVISIDGRKEIHDVVRHDCNGKGSYERIVPLAQELIAGRNGKSYFVRGTFTAKNKDFSNDVMHLADLGFKEISVEPVVGSGGDLYFTDQDIPEILKEYENLSVKYMERLKSDDQLRFYHFNIDLEEGPCLFKRVTACGAGYEYNAVSPEGKLYPCHQFVGHDEFIIGDVYSGISNVNLCDTLKENTIFKKEKCRDCWAKLYCSGGCHANAFFTSGNIREPNEVSCMLQKKRVECALMINVWQSERSIKEL